jgi:hypothetical protein
LGKGGGGTFVKGWGGMKGKVIINIRFGCKLITIYEESL